MSTVSRRPWGVCPAGPVDSFTLTNAAGNVARVMTYGATLTALRLDGDDMILGYDELAGYLGDQPYYGATVGRYGNRIANGRFDLDGHTYHLPQNNGDHTLHGGPVGFDKQLWDAQEFTEGNERGVIFRLTSADGDQGFPGTVHLSMTYTWTDLNELIITYSAVSDRPTVLNPTNHAYFNLGRTADVLDHELTITADRYVPIRPDGIPLGHTAPVAGTPFDFNEPKPIGQDIAGSHEQTAAVGGYDHTLVLRPDPSATLPEFARLHDPATGRTLRAFTDMPGVQLFTTNFEPDQFTTYGGVPVPPHGAVCLETQYFPDAPNQADFVTPVLRPGETFRSVTIYRFT